MLLDLHCLDGGRLFVHRLVERWSTYAAGVVRVDQGDLERASQDDEGGAVHQPQVLGCTLVVLLFVAVIPWPTKLADDHIRAGGSVAGAVAVLYAAALMLM